MGRTELVRSFKCSVWEGAWQNSPIPEHENFVFICREVVYIEKSIAETFQLGNFKPIIVNKVNEEKH
jgi:hypothetical protein